ncbi:MAG: DUF2461 domain-containing protein [Bacteroidales bacterium]|nr:DUF2461 domain-containing protein [Bacteroidales bacterium]
MSFIYPKTVNFLNNLKENNTREWFNDNRSEYEFARQNFSDFTNSLIAAIASFDKSIGTLEAKDCTFRIYRDMRFSANKTPYKTNMGAYISRGGKKSSFAGYYFHLEPNGSFISGGIYTPSSSVLNSIRKDMETYPEEFMGIVESKDFINTFPSIGSESLKKVPRGFSPDSPVANYLKLKHITPTHSVSNQMLVSNEFLAYAISAYKRMLPLIEFLNEAIEQN